VSCFPALVLLKSKNRRVTNSSEGRHRMIYVIEDREALCGSVSSSLFSPSSVLVLGYTLVPYSAYVVAPGRGAGTLSLLYSLP
jgi:hypothetical protein